jgi:Winged helix-turn helix
VPAVQDTSPINAEIVYGGFTAVATSGLPGPDNSVIPTDSTSRISLAIGKASGGRSVFTAANVDTPNGVKVRALTPGTYKALWTLSDANGDRRFVVKRMSTRAEHQSTRIRAAILLASNVKTPVPQIARMWLTDESHVRKVIHEFNEEGFDSLRPDYRGGRPRRITAAERKRVVRWPVPAPTHKGCP